MLAGDVENHHLKGGLLDWQRRNILLRRLWDDNYTLLVESNDKVLLCLSPQIYQILMNSEGCKIPIGIPIAWSWTKRLDRQDQTILPSNTPQKMNETKSRQC